LFTGLIEASAPVSRVQPLGAGLRIWVRAPDPGWEVSAGQSVSVSGACLTVAWLADRQSGDRLPSPGPGKSPSADPRANPGANAGADMVFDLSSETLGRTWLGSLEPGRRVNLERAMRLSDRLDGHLVTGHVDGRGRILAIEDSRDGGRRITLDLEPPLERYLIDKGSIAIDGIGLTVVSPRGGRFDIAAIPVTLEKTTLGNAKPGDLVNVEADLIAKWIERLARPPERAENEPPN